MNFDKLKKMVASKLLGEPYVEIINNPVDSRVALLGWKDRIIIIEKTKDGFNFFKGMSKDYNFNRIEAGGTMITLDRAIDHAKGMLKLDLMWGEFK